MGKPVFLLGAGASIDAGLFDTNRLTREIYKILCTDAHKVPGKVFGYVVAKILARKVRQGGSPFDEVNVEEAYDGVERLVYRDQDIASEFVSSWDPFLDALRPSFDKDRFIRSLAEALHVDDRRSLTGNVSLRFDSFRMREVADEIERATSSSAFAGQTNILPYLTNALLRCLEHDAAKLSYMREVMRFAGDKGAIVGSLNYDLVVENALDDEAISFDYGLSSWNEKKLVSFSGSRAEIRFMKLHGSMNWFGNDDAIVVESERRNRAPLLIFGGGSGKLRPDGPFLQLRHEFERQLLATNMFVVIGYSFGDAHLNALIRRWVSTRRKAKMIIVNPAAVDYRKEAIGTPYTVKSSRLESKTVDITHIKKKTADSVADLLAAAGKPIDLKIPKNRNGALPDILVTLVS